MPYLVATQSGYTSIIEAKNSRDAKVKACKDLNIKPYDSWIGVRSMQAHKIKVSYPKVVYRPLNDEAVFSKYAGKDVIIYDEHHGTATRINKATVAALSHFIDDYSTIIIL